MVLINISLPGEDVEDGEEKKKKKKKKKKRRRREEERRRWRSIDKYIINISLINISLHLY